MTLQFFVFVYHRKKLEDPGAFPILLVYEELGWKLSLGFDLEKLCFTLLVNDIAFYDLRYQAVIE